MHQESRASGQTGSGICGTPRSQSFEGIPMISVIACHLATCICSPIGMSPGWCVKKLRRDYLLVTCKFTLSRFIVESLRVTDPGSFPNCANCYQCRCGLLPIQDHFLRLKGSSEPRLVPADLVSFQSQSMIIFLSSATPSRPIVVSAILPATAAPLFSPPSAQPRSSCTEPKHSQKIEGDYPCCTRSQRGP